MGPGSGHIPASFISSGPAGSAYALAHAEPVLANAAPFFSALGLATELLDGLPHHCDKRPHRIWLG
jgi:hypothetical protein